MTDSEHSDIRDGVKAIMDRQLSEREVIIYLLSQTLSDYQIADRVPFGIDRKTIQRLRVSAMDKMAKMAAGGLFETDVIKQ